jgi:predicted TIM-barrel fold metal-dependent hydrolase
MHQSPATNPALGVPRHLVEWHTLAAPQAGAAHLVSLLFNGVLDRLPDLKVVLLETGVSWVPWLMWRADENYKEYRYEVPWVKRMPSQIMREQVRLSTQPLNDVSPANFSKLIDMAGCGDMFMFSSDYPHYDADTADRVLPPSMPDALRRKIRYENALNTFPRLAGYVPKAG